MLSLLSWQKAIYYLAQVIYYQVDDLALAALPKVKYISACSQQHIQKNSQTNIALIWVMKI